MDGMPRPRPPHLHRQVSRHGKTVWYVRVGKGPRTRIKAAFGTPEFDAEYRGRDRHPAPPPIRLRGSLSAIVRRRHGAIYRLLLGSSAKPSWRTSSSRRARKNMRRSRARQSSPAEIGDTQRQPKRGTSWKQCAGSSGGPQMRSSSKQIPPPASLIQLDQRMPASLCGPRKRLPHTSGAGRSARDSASGSTFCYIRD
jgi:hypothetical protein